MSLHSRTVASNNASVDEKNSRKISAGANFDRFASLNEEWIIRLRNLREDEENLERGDQNDNDCNGESDPVSKSHVTATRTILHAARLANLQCASGTYRERECERRVITDVDRLHLHVQQIFDSESKNHESMIDGIIRKVSPESSNQQKVDEDALQSFFRDDDSCTEMEVDAFFQTYPECSKSLDDRIDSIGQSEIDSDSDDEESCKSGRRKRRAQSSQAIASMTVDLVKTASEPIETQPEDHIRSHEPPISQSQKAPKAEPPTPMDMQPEDQSTQNQTRKTKPLSANNNHGNVDSSTSAAIKNPYSNRNSRNRSQLRSSVPSGQNDDSVIDLSASTSNHDATNKSYNNNSQQGTTSFENNRYGANNNISSNNNNGNNNRRQNQNPYNRSSSQNKSQNNLNQGYSSNFYEQDNRNIREAWRDHQNQTNPFLTAREVALAEENYPHRDPFESRERQNPPKPQNQYNNPYGLEFQGRDHDCSDNFDEAHSGPISSGGPVIPDSLKRKFQRPKRGLGSVSQFGANKGPGNRSLLRPSNNNNHSNSGGTSSQRPSSSNTGGQTNKQSCKESKGNEEEDELPEELQHLDKELVKKIQNEIMESGDTVTFDDIAGLEDAKKTVREVVCWPMQRPDLFTGLRRAPNGLLLYGPPG